MKTILVTAKDSQLAKCIQNLAPIYYNIHFVFKSSSELDITNKDQVQSVFNDSIKFDYCINCAAYTAVDTAEKESKKAHSVNEIGSKNLAEICHSKKITLIHISTDFVFDGESLKPYSEDDVTNPLGVYGVTKLKGELAIKKELKNYFIVRTSWLYSEYGNNFLKTMLNLADQRDEISVVGDQLGSPTYAKDLARTILEFVESKEVSFGTYHYSNDGAISWYDFAKEIFKQSNRKIKLNKIQTKDYPTLASRPNYSVLKTLKIKDTLSIEIPDWKESLASAIATLKMKNNLEKAILAALEAGEAIMKVYNSEIAVEYKDDKSPLTEADKRANVIINRYLSQTGIPIISEENKQTDYEIRKTWNTCWVVDPVDGTKEFIKRNGEFTVNIALVSNELPILGVIYVPVSKTLYFSDVNDKKAHKVELDSHCVEISEILKKAQLLSRPNSENNIVRVVGSRSHMSEETIQYIQSIKKKDKTIEIVSKGSSLKFCIVAEGSADVYPRFAPTMEWDTAAGQAICNALDISVISQETKKPLLYNKENLLNPWFIVS